MRSTAAQPDQTGTVPGRGLVDLTMPISERTVPYPGHPAPTVESLNGDDRMHGTVIRLSVQTGTHIDAPSHLFPGGPSIDQIPIERFWRQAVRIDLSEIAPGAAVGLKALRAAGFDPGAATGKIVLLATGWTDRSWRSDRLHSDSPYLAVDAARTLAAARPAAVGLDFSVDRDPPWESHAALLEAGVPLIENLMGLTALPDSGFEVIAFPFRLTGGNGGPARVVASLPQ